MSVGLDLMQKKDESVANQISLPRSNEFTSIISPQLDNDPLALPIVNGTQHRTVAAAAQASEQKISTPCKTSHIENRTSQK